jgi:CRISPR-associated protein Csd1
MLVPQPTDDIVDAFPLLESDDDPSADTAQKGVNRLSKGIAGYRKDIGDTASIIIMGLDSASPGRLAIIYYRKLTGSDFLDRLNSWHETCAWLHDYKWVDNKRISFYGAPAPHDIAEAAYGSRLDDTLCKSTIERILPCIIDGLPIPRDLVESTIRRATDRAGIKNPDDKTIYGDEEYTWEKTLSIACALFRKYNGKEHYRMALDPERKTRDYLYGRLLSLGESLEKWALYVAHEKQATNATRLMQRFSEHPYSTWRIIELALTPYKLRLGAKSSKRQLMIDDVITSFDVEDFINDKPLSGEFLLGYHCQREYLRKSHTQLEVTENSETNNIDR